MESKYILEVSEDRCGYGFYEGREDVIRDAVNRIRHRIATGNTIVAVRVKNPRYKGE